MRVLGVDPGTLKMGVGVIDKKGQQLHVVHYETIKASNRLPLSKRLHVMFDQLEKLFETHCPDVLAMEDIFYCKDFKAAVKIGEARGLALVLAASRDIEIAEYLPNRVKQAVVGHGHATKEQVQKMVQRLLELKEEPEMDASDALAVAICHCHQNKVLVF